MKNRTETVGEKMMNELKRYIFGKNHKCKTCGSRCIWNKKSEFQLRCTWMHCKRKFSALEGSIAYKSKLKLDKILEVIYLWCMDANTSLICSIIQISKTTISLLYKKMNKHLTNSYYRQLPKLGGENTIVEIDESKFGKRKYHRGHSVEGVWVFGMVEKTTQRKILLFPVERRNADTLLRLIIDNVMSDSIIYSDCWKAYAKLVRYFRRHLTVNHSLTFKDPISQAHTNTIEGNWSAIKAGIPRRKRTKKDITMYLIKFMIKRNEPGDVFANIIKYLF
jgi:transposase-like protein